MPNYFELCCAALGDKCEELIANCLTKMKSAETTEDGIVVPGETVHDGENADEADDQIEENEDEEGDEGQTGEDGPGGHHRSESDLHEEWRQGFKQNFSQDQLKRRTTIQLATSVQTIYLTLVALSALAQQNQETFEDDKRDYYANMSISSQEDDSDEEESADEEVQMKLEKALEAEFKIRINADKFLAQNEEYAIKSIPVAPDDEVTISEYAPQIFRQIR